MREREKAAAALKEQEQPGEHYGWQLIICAVSVLSLNWILLQAASAPAHCAYYNWNPSYLRLSGGRNQSAHSVSVPVLKLLGTHDVADEAEELVVWN